MHHTTSVPETAWCLWATQKQTCSTTAQAQFFVLMAAVWTFSKIIKKSFHINETLEWQGCGKYSQKTETHFVTKAFFYLPTLLPIFSKYEYTGEHKGSEKPGAVVNTALPKPQVTRPSLAIQNQAVYSPLSYHLSAPSSGFTHRSAAIPLCTGG